MQSVQRSHFRGSLEVNISDDKQAVAANSPGREQKARPVQGAHDYVTALFPRRRIDQL